MRRRLDIAMSHIGSPPVIFLDEPTTGLDPQARVETPKKTYEAAGPGGAYPLEEWEANALAR
jgi:ABC-2 type transport system ATP-binding protein